MSTRADQRTTPRSQPATALGLRIKSGWASAVVLELGRAGPIVVHSRRLELADPDTPESYQPYHAGTGKAQLDQRVIARLIGLIERCARDRIAELVAECREREFEPRCAAIVRPSSTDPATIMNPHIRIHALEGQLFPRIAYEALAASGIALTAVLEADLWDTAPTKLGIAPATVRTTITGLGKAIAGPWRADQKTAALAAWTLLAGRPRPRRS